MKLCKINNVKRELEKERGSDRKIKREGAIERERESEQEKERKQ